METTASVNHRNKRLAGMKREMSLCQVFYAIWSCITAYSFFALHANFPWAAT